MDEKHDGRPRFKAKGAYQSSVGQSPDRATHTLNAFAVSIQSKRSRLRCRVVEHQLFNAHHLTSLCTST